MDLEKVNLGGLAAVRCEATESTGIQCIASASTGDVLCGRHGGMNLELRQRASLRLEASRLRIVNLTDRAVDVLEELLEAESEAIRLKASTEILDRSGIRGGVDLNVSVDVGQGTVAAELLRRLEQLRLSAAQTGSEDIIDADVYSGIGPPLLGPSAASGGDLGACGESPPMPPDGDETPVETPEAPW